jgi:C_GCAxxG_C_C family probable redox protein
MDESAKKATAAELFVRGYNCAQAVFASHAQALGMDFETALKISAPMGGGVGRLREVCGAFSACAILDGLKNCSTSSSPAEKEAAYARVQELAEEFRKENGSIICRELLQLQKDAALSPSPAARDAQYYATRPCLKIVECASKIIEAHLSGD